MHGTWSFASCKQVRCLEYLLAISTWNKLNVQVIPQECFPSVWHLFNKTSKRHSFSWTHMIPLFLEKECMLNQAFWAGFYFLVSLEIACKRLQSNDTGFAWQVLHTYVQYQDLFITHDLNVIRQPFNCKPSYLTSRLLCSACCLSKTHHSSAKYCVALSRHTLKMKFEYW